MRALIRFEPYFLRSLPQAEHLQKLVDERAPSDFTGSVVVLRPEIRKAVYIKIRDGKEKTVVRRIESAPFDSDHYQNHFEQIVGELFAEYEMKLEYYRSLHSAA